MEIKPAWPKPSSAWKGRKNDGEVYYTSPGKHGLRYMCKYCGKRANGIGTTINRETGELSTNNHFSRCFKHPEVIRQEELKKNESS